MSRRTIFGRTPSQNFPGRESSLSTLTRAASAGLSIDSTREIQSNTTFSRGGCNRVRPFRSPCLNVPLDHCIRKLRVFCPGTIVEAYAICAGNFKAEGDDSRSDARPAGRRDRLLHIHTFGSEYFTELIGGFHAAIHRQVGKRDA